LAGAIACWNCEHENPADARFCGACGCGVSEAASPPPEPPAPVWVETAAVAGFFRRLAAFVVDAVILVVLNTTVIPLVFSQVIPLGDLFGYGYGYGYWHPSYLAESLLFGFPRLSLLAIIYYTVFTAVRGQTPGKMLLRIKVVNENDRTPGVGYVLLRETIGRLLATIPLYLGFLWIAWDGKKQGWHDKLAGTYVIALP